MAMPNPPPKRHHWWPQLQSGHWTAADGLIYAIDREGKTFRSSPINIGIESQLYTRHNSIGDRDVAIENWFSEQIEGPFVEALFAISELKGLRRSRYSPGDPARLQEVRELGFVMDGYREFLPISSEHRSALVNYLAAMLVRNPIYLSKLRDFHKNNLPVAPLVDARLVLKSVALDNMLHLYKVYQDAISQANLSILKVESENELLFSDAGIVAEEPWRTGPLPFDVHAPLTPTLAIEVLPMPEVLVESLEVMKINSIGVKRFNRIALGNAERFVFSRSSPPVEFIREHFGKPAPKSIGARWRNGRLETMWDKSREH